MRRVFDEGSKVRVIVGETLEELNAQLEDFINDKIVIDISYECVSYMYNHKVVVVYKELPEFEEFEEDEDLYLDDLE